MIASLVRGWEREGKQSHLQSRRQGKGKGTRARKREESIESSSSKAGQ